MQPLLVETVFSRADWEAYALCYDSLRHLSPYMDMLRTVADAIPADEKVQLLDASCGTGNFEDVLLQKKDLSTVSLVGVDMSDEMLASAKKKHTTHTALSFLKADLNAPLPFAGETFSHVVSINTLYAVTSPEATLREFSRVLKKGGTLLLVTPKAGFENGLILKEHCSSVREDEYWKNGHETAEKEEILIREALKDEVVIKDMLTIAKHNRSIASTEYFHFFTRQNLEALLEKVGFSLTYTSFVYAKQDIFNIAMKGI
jgi:ubiquinone/menaquinone biosynthesis C-methylase UbiE